jgi:two-component system response regulator HydG
VGQLVVPNRLTVSLQSDDMIPYPLLGPSRAMRELSRQVELLAQGDRTTALLLGESGTGKGALAAYIHRRSARAERPFVDVHCGKGSPALLAARLFGRTSGEELSEDGLLAQARGGTLFLEEVGALAPELQPLLLRVLGERGRTGRSGVADVRVIASSSRDLVTEVNEGRLREDLYYRLSVMPVHLPPLRARTRDDLAALIVGVFEMLRTEIGEMPGEIAAEAVECLAAHAWPGNVRELRNALERAALIARGAAVLRREHLSPEIRVMHEEAGDPHTPRTLTEMERAHIHRTLRAHKLNRTHAARELGISRATLIKKIKEYGLVHRAPGRA